MFVGLGVGVAVVWFADSYNLMTPAFRAPLVDLYSKDERRNTVSPGEE